MHRNGLRDIAFRAIGGMARATINKAADNPMMQELSSDFMNNDSRQGKVERIQNYGFTSTILPRSEQEGQQPSSGGNGVQPEQPKGEAAEGLITFVGGQRNHPVMIGVDDRRHRPRGLKPGEGAQYDDIGQMTLIRRNGLYLLTKDGGGDDKEGEEETERMVSLRHINKEKQPRPQKQANAAGQENGDAEEEDFAHEGKPEEVNAEVRVTKQKVRIYDGEDVVAVYDREEKSWTFSNFKKMVLEPEEEFEVVTKKISLQATEQLDVQCQAETNVDGHPLNFNGGGPTTTPFTVP